MKRVLFLIDTLEVGGTEKSLLYLVSSLRHYEAIVVHVYPGDALKSEFVRAGVQVHFLEIESHYGFRKARKKLLELVHEVRPALIHSMLFRSDIIARSLKRQIRVPLVNSLVNNSYAEYRYAALPPIQRLKLRIVQYYDLVTAARVDRFVSNSRAIKQAYQNALGIDPGRIQVVFRGRKAPAPGSVPTSALESLRDELNLRDKKVILNVSRLLRRKGQSELITAFGEFHKSYSGWVLLIAGEGVERSALENQIEKMNLRDSVQMLGTRNDVPALLELADLFAFPTFYEGLPGSLIEAMFANVPIVASAIPENLECVDEESAYLFTPGDVGGLRSALDQAVRRYDHSRELAKRAYLVAMERFELGQNIRAHEELYDELLKQRW